MSKTLITEIMQGAACALYIAIIVAIAYKIYFNRRTQKRIDKDFLTISEKIERLNYLKTQLHAIEQLITDVEMCKPDDLEKSLRLDWTTTTGERMTYDLWIDGRNETSKKTLLIAYSERNYLRAALRDAIANLSAHGVTKTVTETIHNNGAGEGRKCKK